MSIATALYTPDDLLRLPDGDRYELVDGQLVEHTLSTWSSYVAGEVYGRIREFCRGQRCGWSLPKGTSYRCFPDDPDKVRRADVSFVQVDRLSVAQATAQGHLEVVPDLVVEVVSPNDLLDHVHNKVDEFLAAGVRLVWVINPQTRIVEIHRPHGRGSILREPDSLDGADVLPGFSCRVGDLFQPPVGAPATN
jgi:Uma2 family endonuclease